jgi:two-component system nitrogen regulation response regulator GlnG
MQPVLRVMEKIGPSDANVLITGEHGTGKEVVARWLHAASNRAGRPLVTVNAGGMSEGVFESELFGHVKGAFTDARSDRVGFFEMADGGTLFLDEIGDMPLDAQTRLLRVIDGTEPALNPKTGRRPNVRVIAATNRDLRALIQQGLFREDLYFRLNVAPVRLPPLRDRTEDIPDLARSFLLRAAREGLPSKTIDSAALDRLKAHSWPGNVRELENLIRRICALYSEDLITTRMIERELQDHTPPPPGQEGPPTLAQIVERHLSGHFADQPDGIPAPGLYDRVLEEVERPLIQLTLAATRGNQVRAAEILGLNRNTLRKKITDLGVEMTRGKR